MIEIKSPNFSSREGHKILAIVCHITDGTKESVISEFISLKTKKSSHYLVCRDGEIVQFVDEQYAAWHAGKKVNPTARIILDNIKVNPNLITIGIEHEAFASQDLTDIQYKTSANLIREICLRNNLSIDRKHVIGHREIRRDKFCPGLVNLSKLIFLSSEKTELEKKINILTKLIELYRQLIIKLKLKI